MPFFLGRGLLFKNKAVVEIAVCAHIPSPCLASPRLSSEECRLLASLLLTELLGDPLSTAPVSLKGGLVAPETGNGCLLSSHPTCQTAVLCLVLEKRLRTNRHNFSLLLCILYVFSPLHLDGWTGIPGGGAEALVFGKSSGDAGTEGGSSSTGLPLALWYAQPRPAPLH